jgi:phage-related protein
MAHIKSYKELRVYQAAMEAAMRIFELTKSFPTEEKYSLTDQIRKASRSVCANIGEAWRKRRYRAHFISKLSDSEGEKRLESGWNSPGAAVICHELRPPNSMTGMIRSSRNWFL